MSRCRDRTPADGVVRPQTQSRNGTEDNPADVLEQSDGRTVLTLHSELEKA